MIIASRFLISFPPVDQKISAYTITGQDRALITFSYQRVDRRADIAEKKTRKGSRRFFKGTWRARWVPKEQGNSI